MADRQADHQHSTALLGSVAAVADCQDFPAGWVDKDGNDCNVYRNRTWCAGDGGPGRGWDPAWGGFADFTNAGHTAATACCACRPAATDTGGRGCDDYARHPHHCGCCDDDDFVASITCPHVCSADIDKERLLQDWDTDLSAWIAEYPDDTRVISLWGYGLTGTVPTDWGRFVALESLELGSNFLTGTIPPELGQLTKLVYLSLSYNKLEGTIPATLGNLSNLTGLYLASNALTGALPPELGNLAKLQSLGLANNDIGGTVPAELGRLESLQELMLQKNQLQGSVPPVLGQLPNLKILWLNDNQLTGTIPRELGELHNLTELWLNDNMMDGTVPPELGKLASVEILSLSSMGISGTIPPQLGNLRSLQKLMLQKNHFQGSVPPVLGQLPNLKILWLNSNQLTGTIPPELGELHNLTELWLNNNMMEGTVPPELGMLASVELLSLSTMGLGGTIPPQLGNLRSLQELWLHSNAMEGTIPAELARLSTLRTLSLYDNRLNGTIPPEIGNMTQVSTLSLSFNQLTGTIPPELSRMVNLLELTMGDNQLQGTLPVELCSMVQLQYLRIGGNALTGTIPRDIGNLTLLKSLELHLNQFEGTLPSTIGNLVQLDLLSLSDNRFHGTLPTELGALTLLTVLYVAGNMLSGTLPSELGNCTQLQTLILGPNRFTGPVPSELGFLQQLTTLWMQGTLLTSLPAEIGKMQALQQLNLLDNPFMTGAFPDTSGCPELKAIYARNCSFTTAGAVGPAVDILDFKWNSFESLPDSWVSLPAVSQLDLSHNKITAWRPFGVLPFGTWLSNGHFLCGVSPLYPRLNWPDMEQVDLSGNPLGDSITTRDFIGSFAYLHRLSDLRAANCGLKGEVPNEGEVLAWDTPNTGDAKCSNVPPQNSGYQALFSLDLSDNKITAIRASPAFRLSLVTLRGNALTGAALHPWWYKVLGNLDVSNNPLLRASVDPPRNDTGCPSVGVDGLQADGFGWASQSSGDAYQCTALCVGSRARYKHDPWLNVSSLCRCKAGRKGAATNCSGCPPDTYSEAEDRWGMVRTCRACPPRSTTDDGVENATSVGQCRCPPGWYMGTVAVGANTTPTGDATNQTGGTPPASSTTPACVQCKQKHFQTSVRGAIEESQCVCNPDYEGLRALRGSCGCVDGMYMDHVAKKCRPCNSAVEECMWGADVERSLVPPVVKPGYWAELWADEEAGNFSENDIWRCVSKDTCKGRGECAAGRQGRTCSLCSAGMYGGPDGPCSPCPKSPPETRKALLLILLIGPSATLLAHILLQGSESHRQVALSLQSLRTSAKQSLKFLQMLGVLSVFSVHWPSAARSFFTMVSHIVVALPEVAGVACLTGQQTASLEMGFRWLLPVAGLASACLTALLLFPARCLCRGRRWHAYMEMGRWDILRVCLWGLVLFHSTMLQFGTQILTCAPSPNGVTTVLTFPHLVCRAGEEWQRLAGLSCAFLTAFVLAVLASVYAAWRRTLDALVQSSFKSRGWWGFLFDDFRNGCTQWVMLVMMKDIALVAVATAGAGDGASQLVVTAAGATIYSYVVLRDQPFRDPSNNMLEAWTSMALASLSLFSAGMGYQATPGDQDGAELDALGVNDALYQSRARAMVTLQWLTFVGPVVIMLYQIATLSDWVRRQLPRFMRPMDEEERKAWNEQFLSNFGVKEAADLRGVVERFDDVDGSHFRFFMGTSTATLGLVASHASGIKAVERRRMEVIAQRSGSFRSSASGNNSMQVAGSRLLSTRSAEEGREAGDAGATRGGPVEADAECAKPPAVLGTPHPSEEDADLNKALRKLVIAQAGEVVVL